MNQVLGTSSTICGPVNKFDNDKTKDGWTYIEDVEIWSGPIIFKYSKIVQDEECLLVKDEKSLLIDGWDVTDRAKLIGGLTGQLHAERLFNRQEDIPQDAIGHRLIFPGTKLIDAEGKLRMPCLNDIAGVWFLDFAYYAYGFYPGDLLVHV